MAQNVISEGSPSRRTCV